MQLAWRCRRAYRTSAPSVGAVRSIASRNTASPTVLAATPPLAGAAPLNSAGPHFTLVRACNKRDHVVSPDRTAVPCKVVAFRFARSEGRVDFDVCNLARFAHRGEEGAAR